MKRNTVELKKNLIQTGVREIQKKGIEQLSLRTIAKSCGVTHGTPYRHFDGKEGYLRAVLAEISVLFHQQITATMDEEMTAQEKLVAMGYQFVLFAKQEPYFFEAMMLKYPFQFILTNASEISTDCEPPGFQGFQQVVEELISEESLTITVATMVFHLWSYITGFAIIANSPNRQNLSASDIEDEIADMLTIYLKGVQS